MSKKEIIENQWNTIFVDFLDQLGNLFPDSPAHSLKTKFHFSQFLGGKKAIVVFLENLDEHSKEIEEENEDYFFKNNDLLFVKELQLDHYYKLSTQENKNIIWSFIKTLYQMSKVYNSI